MKTFILFLTSIVLFQTVRAESVELKEKQIIRNADESIYKTVRLMLHFTGNQRVITAEDIQNLITAFAGDQKISGDEMKVLKQLEGDNAQFAIESPFTKQLLIINKRIEPSATASLNFFWDRMMGGKNGKDLIANYLYLHLPGRFFEYYYHNPEKAGEMAVILDEYMTFICKTSDKTEWNYLKKELSRIYAQINLGNKEKEAEYKNLVIESYKKARITFDLPKMDLALNN